MANTPIASDLSYFVLQKQRGEPERSRLAPQQSAQRAYPRLLPETVSVIVAERFSGDRERLRSESRFSDGVRHV